MTWGELIGCPNRWARLSAWAVALGLLCGIVGPFGSYPANNFTRLAYWLVLFVTGGLILWPLSAVAIVIARRRGYPLAPPVGLALAVGCVPIALLAALGGQLFWPVHAGAMPALEWYGETLCIAVPALAAALWYELTYIPQQSAATPNARATRAVEQRLPEYFLASALCLQMEDHYVRIHGANFSHLQLATLRDAARQIGENRGLQVHRSWWVVEQAVSGWIEDGRSIRLVLINGLEVPVARSRVIHLRERGWLKPDYRAQPLKAAASG